VVDPCQRQFHRVVVLGAIHLTVEEPADGDATRPWEDRGVSRVPPA
jgi:hypothetical protein